MDILRPADRALRFRKKKENPVYPPDFYRMDLQFSAQIHAMHRKISMLARKITIAFDNCF